MVIDCGLCLRNFPLDVHTCSVTETAPALLLPSTTVANTPRFLNFLCKFRFVSAATRRLPRASSSTRTPTTAASCSWGTRRAGTPPRPSPLRSSPCLRSRPSSTEEDTETSRSRDSRFTTFTLFIPEHFCMALGFFFFVFLPLQISVMRNLGPYMISYYVSSAVVVILSWASFVIPNRRIPSRSAELSCSWSIQATGCFFSPSPLYRFTYLAVLLLALICVIGTAEVASPRANVLTSLQVRTLPVLFAVNPLLVSSILPADPQLQIWFLVCTLFLLAPALEFGVLLLRQRRRCRRRAVTVRRVKYEAAAGGSASLGQGGSLNGAGGACAKSLERHNGTQ